ncbi:transketolase C-terminal domain-containing protein, partial [Treponema sp. R6D11]
VVKKTRNKKVIIAVGDVLPYVEERNATIISLTTISPLDTKTISEYISKDIEIIENNVVSGGVGEKIKALFPSASITLKGFNKNNIPKHGATEELVKEIISEKFLRLLDVSIINMR